MKWMQSELLGILPPKLRNLLSNQSLETVAELRLRLGYPMKLCAQGKSTGLGAAVTQEDLQFCVNTASRYSPWSAGTISQGFLTIPGGHRMGLCGEAAGETLRSITSLCIRVAREFPGIAQGITSRENLLILGPPGSGKTTLLRDLIRSISRENRGSVAVVDERWELFPMSQGKPCFDAGENTDILRGIPKARGLDMVLRTMGPKWIALDEITAAQDCQALHQAAWCGVKLLATAHAESLADFRTRPIYRPLAESRVFSRAVVLSADQTYRMEVL